MLNIERRKEHAFIHLDNSRISIIFSICFSQFFICFCYFFQFSFLHLYYLSIAVSLFLLSSFLLYTLSCFHKQSHISFLLPNILLHVFCSGVISSLLPFHYVYVIISIFFSSIWFITYFTISS